MKRDKPSRVGEILSEQISRRVVVLVLLVLFVSPNLQIEADAVTPNLLLLRALEVCESEGECEIHDAWMG